MPVFGSSSAPPGRADPYADLLCGTRDLVREQRRVRDAWALGLFGEGRNESLFELEVLLKSSACFANPRNHPGPPRKSAMVTQDFREATLVFRDGLERMLGLSQKLLGSRDRAYLFHRYLETMLPEDLQRTELERQRVTQRTPEDSLLALRHGLTTTGEVFDGVLRAQRVPFRLFYALLNTVQREVAHNTFFNPLTALEFRPEFDRIGSVEVLELIRSVSDTEARRAVALTFLSLFRMLHYVSLASRILSDSRARRRRVGGRCLLLLSVLRSDARALALRLRKAMALRLAEQFDAALLKRSAAELRQGAEELRERARHLRELREALASIAANLSLELRITFRHELPALDSAPSEADLRRAVATTLAALRPTLQAAVLHLGHALGGTLDPCAVFADESSEREVGARLERDAWMFARIVQAFMAKANQAESDDSWLAPPSRRFVSDYVSYLEALGRRTLELLRYPRRAALLEAVHAVSDADLLDLSLLRAAVAENASLLDFLTKLGRSGDDGSDFGAIPFDRRAAALTLRRMIGEAGVGR